jgi:hypothetical protein
MSDSKTQKKTRAKLQQFINGCHQLMVNGTRSRITGKPEVKKKEMVWQYYNEPWITSWNSILNILKKFGYPSPFQSANEQQIYKVMQPLFF